MLSFVGLTTFVSVLALGVLYTVRGLSTTYHKATEYDYIMNNNGKEKVKGINNV